MKTLKCLAAASAVLALSQAQVAMAQAAAKPCINPADLSDAVIYSMPALIGAFQTKCGPSLAADGYMRTQGAKLNGTYVAQQNATWPGARRFLMQFTANNNKSGNDGMAEMISSLPAEAIRPFVDALIQQEVSKKIPVKDCGKIERGVSLMAPLPPKNLGGLAGFLFQMVDVKNPSICESR
jgi:hypothetical protein